MCPCLRVVMGGFFMYTHLRNSVTKLNRFLPISGNEGGYCIQDKNVGHKFRVQKNTFCSTVHCCQGCLSNTHTVFHCSYDSLSELKQWHWNNIKTDLSWSRKYFQKLASSVPNMERLGITCRDRMTNQWLSTDKKVR